MIDRRPAAATPDREIFGAGHTRPNVPSNTPPDTVGELFTNPAGGVVFVVSAALFLYSLIALGEILLGVLAVLLLVGGYVVVHVLFRFVRAVEQLASAAERRADAGGAVAEESE